jgi:hypothetical protein
MATYTITITNKETKQEVDRTVDENFFTLNREEIGEYIQELADGLYEIETPF